MTVPSDPFPTSSSPFFAEPNHHLVKHLTIVAAIVQGQLVALQNGPALISRELASAAMRDTAARITVISILHRLLACIPDSNEIDLRILLKDCVEEIVSTHSDSGRVHLREALHAELIVGCDEAAIFALILCEIIMNAIRFSRASNARVVLDLSSTQGAEGGTILEISDNAVALSKEPDRVREGGVGIKLITAMAGRIGASLSAHASPIGLSYRFTLP